MLKCQVKFRIPFKFTFGTQELAEWGHDVPQLSIVGDLVYQAKPALDVSSVAGCGEGAYGIQIPRKWFDTIRRNPESCKLDLPLRKLKLLGVEYDPRGSNFG